MDKDNFAKLLVDRVAKRSPLTAMTRAAIENGLSDSQLDEIFERVAEKQYLRELTYSTIVKLMAMVVLKVRPSILSAYRAVEDEITVSVTSVYNKLDGLEPKIGAATVAHSANRLGDVIESMGGELDPLLPGYQLRIVDGNHIAATERRLEVLKRCAAGPLPGQCLAVYCPSFKVITNVIPCEDAHAQERAMSEELLELVKRKDVWMADRNFCTAKILFGIASLAAFFIVREHRQSQPWEAAGDSVRKGRTDTGEVFEQAVTLLNGAARLAARRITIKLNKPTRDGDKEIHIFTNLPKDVPAVLIAKLYAERWTLEIAFQELTENLSCEVDTLGYPKAALFAFCLAAVAYNILSVVKAALRAEHGHEEVEDTLSGYYLAQEISTTYSGIMAVVPEEVWEKYQTMSPEALGRVLKEWAKQVKMKALRKSRRGPKKPVPPRTKFKDQPHVSTARLLAEHDQRKRAKKAP